MKKVLLKGYFYNPLALESPAERIKYREKIFSRQILPNFVIFTRFLILLLGVIFTMAEGIWKFDFELRFLVSKRQAQWRAVVSLKDPQPRSMPHEPAPPQSPLPFSPFLFAVGTSLKKIYLDQRPQPLHSFTFCFWKNTSKILVKITVVAL